MFLFVYVLIYVLIYVGSYLCRFLFTVGAYYWRLLSLQILVAVRSYLLYVLNTAVFFCVVSYYCRFLSVGIYTDVPGTAHAPFATAKNDENGPIFSCMWNPF